MPLARARLLLISTALLLLAAMAGLRAAFLIEERNATLTRVEAGLRDLSRAAEQYATRVFETSDLVADHVVARVAELGGVERLRGDVAIHHWLRDLSARIAGDHLMITDARGRPVALTAHFPAPDIDLSDRGWFQAHLAGEDRHIGEALHSRITNEMLFTYSRLLRRADGGFDGTVQVSVRPSFFQVQPLLEEFGGGVLLSMIDLQGRVLARTGMTPEQIGGRASAGTVRRALAGDERMFEGISPVDGMVRLAVVRKVPNWPVIVAVSVPRAQALAGWWRGLWWSAAVLGGMALAVALALWQGLRLVGREARVRAELARANAALAARAMERETQFRAIFDSTFQFIGLLRPDGTLLEANRAALQFGGFSRDSVVGTPFWDAPWWDTGAETRARLRRAIEAAAAGEPQRYEVSVRGAEGRRALIDFSLKPIRDERGQVVLLLPEGHDITELKAAEARLREAQKTEMLGQLTGGVAHDFNNLLMAVLGNLALLKKRLPDDPRLARLLDGAQQGAERGAALTQRLLAFARRQELKPAAVDLVALLEGVRPLLERSAGPKVTLAVAAPAGLVPALVDANQLELALLNLVVNARDAMPDGGRVAITLREAITPALNAPSGLLPGRYLVVEVRDGGTGMDAATLARAAEPFFTTKGPGRGSGLGLSMVQGLAQQSGGGLALESAPGSGTRAAIWLPRAAAAPPREPPREAPRPAPPSAAPKRVLVVDDDPLVAAGTAMMLEDLGHQPVVATAAGEALDLLGRDRAIELVLTDHAMPGMTGLELAERLRAERPELPVALATGYAEAVGPSGWLPRLNKPYRQEELAALVAKLSSGAAAATRAGPPAPAPPPGCAA